MKKHGFTLAEVLITLGIIGVVAALVLPAINNLRPNEIKSKYLKTYYALCDTVKEMVSNSKEYPLTDGSWSYSNAPLLNNNSVSNSVSRDNNYNDAKKFCELLAWKFNAVNGNSCSDTIYNTDPASNLQRADYWSQSFSTKDGTAFSIRPHAYTTATANAAFGMNVIVDVNGDAAPNCIYDANNCKAPDTFWFFVYADGRVVAADPMSRMYNKTSKTTIRKNITVNEDYQVWENTNIMLAAVGGAGGGANNNGNDQQQDEIDCRNNGGTWDSTTNTCTEPVIPNGGAAADNNGEQVYIANVTLLVDRRCHGNNSTCDVAFQLGGDCVRNGFWSCKFPDEQEFFVGYAIDHYQGHDLKLLSNLKGILLNTNTATPASSCRIGVGLPGLDCAADYKIDTDPGGPSYNVGSAEITGVIDSVNTRYRHTPKYIINLKINYSW